MSGFPDSHACIATSAPKPTREQTSMAMPAQVGNRPGPEARQEVPAFQGSLSPDLVQASCQESPALATEPGQARKARRILAGWIGRAASCVHMCGRRARSGGEEKRQHGRRQQAADDGHISRGRPWRRRISVRTLRLQLILVAACQQVLSQHASTHSRETPLFLAFPNPLPLNVARVVDGWKVGEFCSQFQA